MICLQGRVCELEYDIWGPLETEHRPYMLATWVSSLVLSKQYINIFLSVVRRMQCLGTNWCQGGNLTIGTTFFSIWRSDVPHFFVGRGLAYLVVLRVNSQLAAWETMWSYGTNSGQLLIQHALRPSALSPTQSFLFLQPNFVALSENCLRLCWLLLLS